MADPAPALREAVTVSQLVRRLKRLIDDNISFVWVEGEISQYKVHRPSGHHYFTLKDEETVINCAMWKSFASRLKFKPEAGMEVFAFGKLDIYPPRGTYQLLVQKMEPKGAGALQLRFEELKKKLEKEGLFSTERKRPLPKYPRTVAIVTSPTGAALRDMLRVLKSRFPRIDILIHPALVQGDGAAEEIAQAIAKINLQRPEVDVLIAGRGGGSLEDLWAFNEEAVARAIFRSRIPVISAVGHETDFTIADFTADVRAATPTEAAVLAVPELSELMETLRGYAEQMARRPRDLFAQYSQRVDELQDRLTDALQGTAGNLRDRLDRHRESLHSALPRQVRSVRQRLDDLSRSRGFARVEHSAVQFRDRLDHAGRNMSRSIEHRVSDARRSIEAAAGKMDALSPLKVLGRGYSITLDEAGKVITDASSVKAGDAIQARLLKGRLRARVEESLAPDESDDTMSRP